MSLATIAGGDGLPPEPEWSLIYNDVLDVEMAREQWGIVTRELSGEGTLSVANGHAIKRLVEFRVIYERAAKSLAGDGAILRARRTKVPQTNPAWPIMRQASEQITSLETELCISPRRRGSAVKTTRKAKVTRGSDEFLKPRSS
jgi:P27 family predicted phage terminase small subunit